MLKHDPWATVARVEVEERLERVARARLRREAREWLAGTSETARQPNNLAVLRSSALQAWLWLRAPVGVLALSLLAAAGLTALALTHAQSAQHARQQAQASARQAQQQAVAARNLALSCQLAAQAITRLDSQYNLALLLSMEARRPAGSWPCGPAGLCSCGMQPAAAPSATLSRYRAPTPTG